MRAITPDGYCWPQVETYVDARIKELHLDLEEAASPDRVARIQGRIAELRELLAAAEQPDTKVADERPSFY